ncbi:hypothetical protein KGA66_18110 [Actinocrinis puniceicyclus]|uniref:Uncharacterized protein n=1 Tax=Actinocrinis puniceicyclus TaxID=977794 RepID=A0A8J7WR89_9ACTN|nr:hypothetical protein [Actinocrinis puniceicyclus]MBS2964977.1 hypothetical protein [Actinocrinis puniceicyclus]
MNADHESWEGIPCILPDWIYTADLDRFEARLAVKRRNANYFADVVGIDPSESESAEILKMIRTARDVEDAARRVKHELVIEAYSEGILLREIGGALGIGAPGVSNILDRNKLAPERKLEIAREFDAWASLTHLWNRDIDTSEPGESFYRHGVYQLLLAQRRFDQAIAIHGRKGEPSAVYQKLQLAYETLHDAFLSLTDPVIPHVIAKYAPKRSLDDDFSWSTMPDATTASTRHGIFKVVLAKLVFAESLEPNGPADIMLAGTYMASALVSLSRPEAQFIFGEMMEFLRREHPDLLPSTHLTPDQIFKLHERQFGSDGRDDLDDLDDE